MYVGYTNIFSTPKGILISDIHCIRYAGYKNIVCNSQRCSYNRHPLYYYMYVYENCTFSSVICSKVLPIDFWNTGLSPKYTRHVKV